MATRRQAKRAIELHESELVGYPNVIGLGIVPAENQTEPGESEVAVYVTRTVPKEELAPGDRIPKTLQIPGRSGTHEVPTQVIGKGHFEFEEDDFSPEMM